MKIVIAGASGFVGSALMPALVAKGHVVLRLVRARSARAANEVLWNPANGTIDETRLEGTDAFVNLAGENVGAKRWTAARREAILRSRVEATSTLVEAIGHLSRKPEVLLNASAIGFFGERGDEVLTETSPIGHGFLPEVCLAWETHAARAAQFGVRTVFARFGVILAASGGALAKMLPVFRLGLGGRLGSGEQWMSWVARDDVIAAIEHLLRDTRCHGPVNVVAPSPVTNAEFTAELGRALRRPAILRVPAWALRAVVGRGIANEALLASARAAPKRLAETGFTFRQPTLGPALQTIL